MENVVVDENTGELDFNDELTENTKFAFPMSFVGRNIRKRVWRVKNILCGGDAFGVIPQFQDWTQIRPYIIFYPGYQVAGTERGVIDPSATFSTCFAAPFLHDTLLFTAGY